MNTNIIIEDIERRYMQYSMSNSDTMLYYRTRDFVEFLKSYDVVNKIIEDIKLQTPFTENIMIDKRHGDRKLPDDIMRSVGNSRDAYVSFLLHYLEWTFSKKQFDTLRLYDDTSWTCSNNNEYSKKDRIRLFQQDVVFPITTYIIDRLRKGQLLCSVLEQFSVRAMRFKCLQGVKSERDVQDRIALYLYDNGNENHREENSGNGNPDFLISDLKELFVVEVKYIKAKSKKGKKDFEEWTSQLKSYMARYSSHHGVLYIVTEENLEFAWKTSPCNMSLMNVYIGDKKPSEIGKPLRIEIDVKK